MTRLHRRLFAAATTLCATALVAVSLGARPSERPAANTPKSRTAKVDRFVVHEWGTFTNFSGSTGMQVDFRPLVDDDLPDFVVDRYWGANGMWAKERLKRRQRMETPVTYFYSDRVREVRVRVDFRDGLLTEFYPRVKTFGPEFTAAEYDRLPVNVDSFLDWGKVRVIPEQMISQFAFKGSDGVTYHPTLAPVVGDNHYAYARETDSAWLQVGGGEWYESYEKFLFYRGVGNFTLPVKFAALGGGSFEVTNTGKEPLRSLFLVRVENGKLFFSEHDEVAAGASVYLKESPQSASADALGESMVRALVAAKLYEKEARSMVKTWRSSWFTEEGTRLLYLVPPSDTERILPLSIEPAPDELVRVLVGRMEVLTPERGARLAETIGQMGTCVLATAEPLESEVARLGRFAEPALEILRAASNDPMRTSAIDTALEGVRGRLPAE